jgi:hypothetical protein
MPRFRSSSLPFWLLCAAAAPAPAAVPEKVDFNFHVKPILSDRCYYCHGPDDKTREAKLRLDRNEDALRALKDRDGWHVIKPGAPAQSSVIERILSTDPDEMMPPPKSKLSLTADEKAILTKWIEQGAEWKDHWAFLPVSAPPVPEIPEGGNAIDAFLTRTLQKTGQKLKPEATKEKLIRRASFALTGLPPSLEQIDAFLADNAPDAFARVVDQFLASPAYGERMAVDWCDIARYADTYGYQNDRHRDMWPWRDWVIRAFNDNLPFDQFITWQLAGDLLENPTRDQRIATAFNRHHRQTNEGGSVDEEFRVEYVNDRTTTYGTAFLGLTLECSRCHDHKYDPVSMRDYYSLTSFFANVQESGLYSHFTNATPAPSLLLSTPDQEQKLKDAAAAIAAQETKVRSLRASRKEAFAAWNASRPATLAIPDRAGHFGFESLDGGKSPNSDNAQAPASAFENPQLAPGKSGSTLQLDGENGVTIPAGGQLTRDDPFTIGLWIKPSSLAERAVIFHRSRAWSDAGSQGFELLMENGRLTASVIHFWPGNAISIRTREAVAVNAWTHVAMAYNGSSRAGGLSLWINGTRADCEVVWDKLYKGINEAGVNEITIGQRFRDRGFKGGAVDEFHVFTRQLTAPEIATLAGAPLPEDAWFDYWLSAVDEMARAETAALTALRRQRSAAGDRIPELMVMEELQTPRKTYTLNRGAYDSRGQEVVAGVPDAILPWDAAWPKNRLGLAKWTTDARNPLTARVTVNRLWTQMWGRGLVATPEDFGNQGSLPSHPEILDWLAAEFIRSGWNVKHILRTIALSQAWRQDSRGSAEEMAADPENILLARGPRFRLPAEMIRDNALAVSGLLVSKLGGPSVKPYQPEGIWEEKGGGWSYQPDKGEGLYRRSLYTYWKRTAPPPAMETFDTAKREVCSARRQVTNTPLQALVLMNDVQHVEAARVTAAQLLTRFPAPEAASKAAFRHCTSREPAAAELQVLLQYYETQRSAFAASPSEAAALLKFGEAPAPSGDPAATAAMTMVVSTLFNHAECVTLR